MPSGLATTAFRITQETLSNIIKHAAATIVFISIDINADNSLQILVVDNGCGFDYEAMTPGVGIIGMRERVIAFNGTISIESKIGNGTVISVNFPIETPTST